MALARAFRRAAVPACIGLALAAAGAPETPRVFIVGQDLDAIRGYLGSGCCPRPDGLTAYVSLYNLLAESAGYGGAGIDAEGRRVGFEHTWGSGPVSASATATAFGIDDLAVGLDITEGSRPGAIDELLAGAYDDEIDHLGYLFALVRGRVFLRIGYEFDGAWNAGYEDPARFVAAFRHIAGRLRKSDADNVEFVWQASASPLDDVIDGGRDDIARWYPGDDHVDWFGVSWFMHPDETPSVPVAATPPTPRQLAEEVVDLARAAGKPVLVAEAAPQGFDLARLTRRFTGPLWDGAAGEGERRLTPERIWRLWYEPLFAFLDRHGDVVRGLAYINCHWDAQPMWGPPYRAGYWGDSRLEASPEIAARFSDAVARWRGGR